MRILDEETGDIISGVDEADSKMPRMVSDTAKSSGVSPSDVLAFNSLEPKHRNKGQISNMGLNLIPAVCMAIISRYFVEH